MNLVIKPISEVEEKKVDDYLNKLFFDYGVPDQPIKISYGDLHIVELDGEIQAVFFDFKRKDGSHFLGPVLSHFDGVLRAIQEWNDQRDQPAFNHAVNAK